MYNKAGFALCFVLLTLGACQKIYTCGEDKIEHWGAAGAVRNGVPWIVTPQVLVSRKFPDKLNMSFADLDQCGYIKEQCSIFKVPTYPGTYPLKNSSIQTEDSIVGASYFYVNVDVITGYYPVLEADSSSFVTITSIDSVSQEIRGTFEITFKAERRPHGAPDTIRLRKGVFHTIVLEL